MKFRHHFTKIDATPSMRTYRADNVTVRLDFIEHILRVAIIRDGEPLFPTYTVRPRVPSDPAPGSGLSDFPIEGRDKLSTEGFSMIAPDISEDENAVRFSIDGYAFTIELDNFRIAVIGKGGRLYGDGDYLAYNFAHEYGHGSSHYILHEDGEQIFGLGDKAGDIDKSGRSFSLAAADAMGYDASETDPLYKQLPFYIARHAGGSYGIYYDTYSNGELSLGREINNYYSRYDSFHCDEENMVFYLILGKAPEIVRRFSQLCGPMLFPPKWTLSYAGSTMTYTDADDADAQLRGFIEKCGEYGVTPRGFYLSSGYTQIGQKRYVFHWNTEKIPSPEGLAEHFKENGVEFFPNVKPAFLTDHPMYDEIAQKGWFLHYEDGTPAVFPYWDEYASYLDFTHPDAYRFWTEYIRRELVERGYKNIWNDNNEYDVRDEEVWAHGFGQPVRAHLIRPLFSMLMTMASLEAQDKSRRTVSVSRCGIGGLPRIATTWTGDNRTDFSDLRYNHKIAMTMSLSGFYNFGQDIGGFAGPAPDAELFLRWIHYGIFTPRFVLHSWNPDSEPTMPWLYPEKKETVRRLFELREALVPYLYNEMYRSVCTYDPIIYPIFLKYPDYDIESDAFFFGNDIIAAPVFDRGADFVTVTLPENEGGWYLGREAHADSGASAEIEDQSLNTPNSQRVHIATSAKIYHGAVTIPCGIDDMPVYFIRAGAIIPEVDGSYTAYPTPGTITFRSFLIDDGESWLTEGNHHIENVTIVYDSDGKAQIKIE